MTREQARLEAMEIDRDAGNNGGKYIDVEEFVMRIYDDFEEELKRVYKDGIKDEARCNQKELSRHINEVEKKQHEKELKKAYIEGSNDAWKARNESIEKAIVSVEDNYGWMTHEDKQNCIEILYGLME